jgi:hypothetical protein
LRKLIAVASAGVPYRLMSGPDRALCYRLALSSGFRFAEIASITPGSFDLEATPPTVSVSAAYTKNGERATQDLPEELAADLRF